MRRIVQIMGLMVAILVGLTACAPSGSITPAEPDVVDVLPLSKDRPTLVLFYSDD